MNPLRSALLVLGLLSLAACGDSDSTSPADPYASVAGTYHATHFQVVPTDGDPLDVLALGGSADIELTAAGTTTGTLVIPPPFSDDGVNDEIVSLDGSYTVTGNTLTFQGQGSASFIQNVVWTIGTGTLTGLYTQPNATVEVTLTRT